MAYIGFNCSKYADKFYTKIVSTIREISVLGKVYNFDFKNNSNISRAAASYFLVYPPSDSQFEKIIPYCRNNASFDFLLKNIKKGVAK